jgi:hypothetical protein
MTTRNTSEVNQGWMLTPEVMSWIDENIQPDSVILEFGSGHGSIKIAEKYKLWSIEHDSTWIGVSNSIYIEAKIIANPISDKYGERGWYDFESLSEVPDSVELIIIDGPPGKIGRSGILHYLEELPTCRWILIDDTDRNPEAILANELIKRLLVQSTVEIISELRRSNNSKRKTTIIQLEGRQ